MPAARVITAVVTMRRLPRNNAMSPERIPILGNDTYLDGKSDQPLPTLDPPEMRSKPGRPMFPQMDLILGPAGRLAALDRTEPEETRKAGAEREALGPRGRHGWRLQRQWLES